MPSTRGYAHREKRKRRSEEAARCCFARLLSSISCAPPVERRRAFAPRDPIVVGRYNTHWRVLKAKIKLLETGGENSASSPRCCCRFQPVDINGRVHQERLPARLLRAFCLSSCPGRSDSLSLSLITLRSPLRTRRLRLLCLSSRTAFRVAKHVQSRAYRSEKSRSMSRDRSKVIVSCSLSRSRRLKINNLRFSNMLYIYRVFL